MELDLLTLFSCDGKKVQFDDEISVSPLPGDDFKVCTPVKFKGTAQNIGGTVEIFGDASVTLKFVCDRCTEEYEEVFEFPVKESYKKSDKDSGSSAEENPDITYIENTIVDLADIVYTNMYINIPSKHLCDEDCKGLCSECGANLNKCDCGCSSDVTDPRFDILDSLLKD